jgi:hypothetical protein
MRSLFPLAFGSILVCCSVLSAAEDLRSGCKPGTKMARFPVKAATGPERGKTLCYVCKSGVKPGVFVFTRKLTPDLVRVVKTLDEQIRGGEGEARDSQERGAVVVLLDDNTRANVKRLESLATKERIQIPLAVNARGKTDPPYELNPQVLHTFVFYKDRAVVKSLAFNTIDARDFRAVAKATQTTFGR